MEGEVTKRPRIVSPVVIWNDESPDVPLPQTEENREAFKIVGSGVFNCIILQPDGTVIRATEDSRANSLILKKVERGSAVLSILNNYKDMLGPSVLHLVQPGQWWDFNDIPEQLQITLKECKNINSENARIYLQKMEFASEGNFDDIESDALWTQEYDAQYVFCLLWFFYVAQAQFGFLHHDVKGENIVLRKSPEPMTYTFMLTGDDNTRRIFSFNAPYVPVVIDLDFGSFYNPNSSERLLGGELSHTPPHVLVDIVRRGGKNVRTFDPYFDLYSLGITLMTLWLRPYSDEMKNLHKYYSSCKYDAAYRDVIRGYGTSMEVKNPTKYLALHFLLRSIVWSRALGIGNMMPFVRGSRTIMDEGKVKREQWLDGRIRGFSKHQKQLLTRLLAWDPQERAFGGETHRLLTDMTLFETFRVDSAPDFGKLYTYGIYPAMEALPPDSERKKMLLNALGNMKGIQSCASCGRNSLSIPRLGRGIESAVTALRLCSCCHLPFCSVECQESAH